MKHLLFAAALLLAVLSCSPANAEVGVYGKLDLMNYTQPQSGSKITLYGGGIGVDYTFIHAGPLRVGTDLHGDFTAGDSYDYRSLLFGLPVGLKLPGLPLRPYVEPVIGVGGSKVTGPTAAGITPVFYNNLTYGGVGGVALSVLPHVEWRVIEVGYTREKSGSDPNLLISTSLGVRF